MARLTITVDDRLLRQVQLTLGVRSKVAAVRAALVEVLRRRSLAAALQHGGRLELSVDQAELARLRDPVVEAVRTVRKQHAASLGNDLDAIFTDLKAREAPKAGLTVRRRKRLTRALKRST